MPYIFIVFYLTFCAYWYDYRSRQKYRNASYFIAFLLLVAMSSLRYRVGGDALFYADYYPKMPTLEDASYYIKYQNIYLHMPLWIYLTAICKSISDNVVLFQIIHSFIFNTFLFVFIKRYTDKYFSVLLLLFMSLLYLYFGIEIQREVLAISIFLYNIKNLEEKRWVKYYFFAIFSFLFHVSAIIIFVLPFFRFIKFNRRLVILLLFISFIIPLISNNIFNFFSSFILLDTMKSRADYYSEITFSLLGLLSYYAVRVLLFIPLALYLYSKEKRNLKYNWFYSSFLIISILAQFFVMFERFLNYLYPLYLIIVIEFLYYNFPTIKSLLLKSIIVVSVFLHIFFIIDYKLFTKNSTGQHYYALFFPYNSVFNPQINKERENYYY